MDSDSGTPSSTSSGPVQITAGIDVFVRIRPLTKNEKQKFPIPAIVATSEKEVTVRGGASDASRSYGFSRVFGPISTQKLVYDCAVAPVIDDVVGGYNCTVFAYGQTGTGKTYTMEGERSNRNVPWNDDPTGGMIPRAVYHLFEALHKRYQATNVTVGVEVSYVELYNEQMYDLLAPPGPKDSARPQLMLYDDPMSKGSVVLKGVTRKLCKTKEQVISQLERGALTRRKASTLLNTRSSRSHAIFMITVYINDEKGGGAGAAKKPTMQVARTGKLNLVDLAGSESIGRSGARDAQAREAGCINKSLLNLRIVINCLAEGGAQHIPYRGSKLTRILQDSLGGKTKTTLIATVSPVNDHLEESISTLDYACKAKSIVNRPESSEKSWDKMLIADYIERIEQMRSDLAATRQQFGVYMRQEEYNIWTKAYQEKLAAYLDKRSNLDNFLDEKARMEAIVAYLDDRVKEVGAIAETFEEGIKEADKVSTVLYNRHQALKEKGDEILSVAKLANDDVVLTRDALSRMREVNARNREAYGKFRPSFQAIATRLSRAGKSLKFEGTFGKDFEDYLSRLSEAEANIAASLKGFVETAEAAVCEMTPGKAFDPTVTKFCVSKETFTQLAADFKDTSRTSRERLADVFRSNSAFDSAISAALKRASDLANERAFSEAESLIAASDVLKRWADKKEILVTGIEADLATAKEKLETGQVGALKVISSFREACDILLTASSHANLAAGRVEALCDQETSLSAELDQAQDLAAAKALSLHRRFERFILDVEEAVKQREAGLEDRSQEIRDAEVAAMEKWKEDETAFLKKAQDSFQKSDSDCQTRQSEMIRDVAVMEMSRQNFNQNLQGLHEAIAGDLNQIADDSSRLHSEIHQRWFVDVPGKFKGFLDCAEGWTAKVKTLFEDFLDDGFVEYEETGKTPRRRGDGEGMATPLRIPRKAAPVTPREAVLRKHRDMISQMAHSLVDTPQIEMSPEESDESKENDGGGLENPPNVEKTPRGRGNPLSAAAASGNSGPVRRLRKIREN